MSARDRAAHHRQLAANAIVTATRMTSKADQETLLLIARAHLTQAEKASLGGQVPDHKEGPRPETRASRMRRGSKSPRSIGLTSGSSPVVPAAIKCSRVRGPNSK
jgi:hypothetical protein